MTKKPREHAKRSPPSRIILGIDPGVAIIGYAALREERGSLTLLACDVIRTSTRLPLEKRLQSMYEQIHGLLHAFAPTEAAIEALFFGKNRKTAMEVGQARGVLLLALAQQEISVAHYSPSQVKLAVTGYGGANKQQVGEMVRVLLTLPAIPRPDDAADAAAVALCHATVSAWRSRINQPIRKDCQP